MANGSPAVQMNLPARKIERAVHPRPSAKVVAKAKTSHNLRAVLIVLAIASVAFLICWRFVQIYNVSSEINQAKTSLAALNAQNSQISMDIQQKVDKTTLDAYAQQSLGMVSPKSDQYVYLNLKNQDVVVNTQKAANNKPPILIQFFRNIIDYFK